ncbi:glutathione S-transferase family protein [Hyphococcus sp. DH-69]|uniref:glutathione S-transferase family protein n=1 Tax=Hyphococcus formosus TaxID=3143534 RepID=UPI00398B3DFC
MTMKLIHFPMTRSIRVAWAIYELGLDVEIETCPFEREKLKEPEYLALNPVGKTPVFLEDGKPMLESVAIIEYLSNKYADGRLSRGPKDSDYADYLQFMEFGEAGMGAYIGMLAGQTAILPKEQRIEAMKIWSQNETKNCLNFLEKHLTDREYLLDEFSLADISVGYALFLIKITRNGELMDDATKAYFERLTARDAWKKVSALEPA